MNLIYPRCCVLALQGQKVLACLRLQEAESPAHEEVRTFAILAEELGRLSDWLASHGVTHVAIGGTNHAWGPIQQRLQEAFTVLLIDTSGVTDGRDLGRIAALLAYGLEPSRRVSPTPPQEPPPHRRRTLVTVGLMIAAVLLTASWVWKHPGRLDPVSLPPPAPSHVVRWQEAVVSHQYPAAKPFTFSLPQLDRSPKDMPVEVTLDASGDRPSWLQFDREQLSMRGVAPGTAKDQTYRLIVRAHAAPGSDSQLLVLLTITGQPDEMAPTRPLPGHWAW
jgi:hypothetical protein